MAVKKLTDYLVYLAVRLFVCLVQATRVETGERLAEWLAWLAYRADRRHREVALENLRGAFPGRYSDEQLDRLVRGVYRHFAVLIVEIAHLPRKLHSTNWRRYVRVENKRAVVAALLEDRPAISLSGHFGNWEMAGYVFGVFGFRSYTVARPLDNVYLDRFLRKFREMTGQKLVPKKGSYETLVEVLAGGGRLSLLADQDAGHRGLFVEFFGRPASTHKAIALLALEHGATVVVAYARRLGAAMHYEVGVSDIIRAEEMSGSAEDLLALTQRYTWALESAVRLAPEQYLWLHRRWKSQPKRRAERTTAA